MEQRLTLAAAESDAGARVHLDGDGPGGVAVQPPDWANRFPSLACRSDRPAQGASSQRVGPSTAARLRLGTFLLLHGLRLQLLC